FDSSTDGQAPKMCEASMYSSGDPELRLNCADLPRDVGDNGLLPFVAGDRVVRFTWRVEDEVRRTHATSLTRDAFGHATAHVEDLGDGYLHINQPGWLAMVKPGFGPFVAVVRPDRPLHDSVTFHAFDAEQN